MDMLRDRLAANPALNVWWGMTGGGIFTPKALCRREGASKFVKLPDRRP